MSSLAINLSVIFGVRLFSSLLIDIVIPYIAYLYVKSNVASMGTPAEQANLKVKYDPLFTLLQDYSEVVIQFGYIAMFASALPIASCIALITNTVWIKGLIWKMFHVFQRPFPSGAQDIGFWQDILLIIATVAVVTNAGLIVFTMSTLNQFSDAFRFWTFILFQWICLAIQQVVMALIPDEPEAIKIQKLREQFIVRKLVDKVPEPESHIKETTPVPLTIRNYREYGKPNPIHPLLTASSRDT
mmetsp:Transcript_16124/g.23483  ORF Transcript_16124/g.23483 Transcript_16124/m.23483 type:complete len:243 (+) Transcript_16124:1-729(+)